MYFELAFLWSSLEVKKQLIYYKVKRFKSSSSNAVFFMVVSFASLQVFFNIFFLKLGVKWRRLWNSSKNFELSVFILKWYFFVPFRNGHLHNVASTFTNDVKLDVEKCNVVSTWPNVAHINLYIQYVDSTLLHVVNSNVEMRNVVSTLIWGCTTSLHHINQKITLKQRWNVCWVFTITTNIQG